MTTCDHFAVSHGLTGCEPKMTNRQFLAARAENPNSYGSQTCDGPIPPIPPGEVHITAEGANAHNYRNLLAEQRVN